MLLRIHCKIWNTQPRLPPKEGIMVIYLLLCCLFVVLISVGAVNLQPWESNRHVLNVEWMDDSDKFELITRWGVIG